MSPTAAPPRIANNLDYSREQLRPGAGDDRSHGFDYAIQPDGTSLAEQKWRELRRSARTCFQLHNPTTNNDAPRISLCDLDRRLRSAAQQYQKRRLLPQVDSSSNSSSSNNNRNYATAPQINPPPRSSISNSSTLPPPPPQLPPSSSFNQNNNNKLNGRENSENGFQSASAILASHCNRNTSTSTNNNNNKPFPPPASSATAASNFSAPPSRPIHSTAASPPPPSRKNSNAAALPPPEADLIHIDDDLDDALSNLDVEQLMSRQSNNHYNRNNGSHLHHPPQPPSGAALPSNPLRGGSNNNNNPYSSSNNNNSTNMYNNNNSGSGFDFYDNSTAEHRVGDSSSVSYHPTATTTNKYNSSSTTNNNAYNTVSGSSSYDSSFGGFDNNNNNFDSFLPTYADNSTNNHNSNGFGSGSFPIPQNNNDSFGGGIGDNFNNDIYQNRQPQHHQPPDGAPSCLCPEHNLPCMVLTARSEANNGREFFKCSVPDADGGCGFVGWVDRMEGNWNNNAVGDAPVATTPGDYKDCTIEARHKFGHRNFRPGQKEVIQNAMAKRDVFVLMPTGGGKSLCYQLPAWCCPGLTVVVSPLLSLIQDQCQSMNTLGVQSVFLSSTQDYASEQVDITRRLNEVQPHGGVKLLYITPEKLSNSSMMQNLLRRIYQKGLISRFVVDEAHCISDWAHDFRPDYNKLGMLRTEYPGVPIMALTATANNKVVNDAIRGLRMQNEYRYVSSFNRPNLRYEVRKKDGKTIDNIADYVAQRPNDSGVIYCLSRKNCEDVAQKIQEKLRSKPDCRGVRVSFYHAELDAHERERRHHEWSNGRISVLCATIAFGMGIDKPDVRYVIHFSMPKSITHYYQESGRAGRDRDVADCILYYQYKDKNILENMIVKSSNDPYGPATRRKIDQLYTCVRYCEDQFRCRRTMQLEFFGETFDRCKCNKTCDNCQAEREPDRRDLTSEAQTILRLFDDVSKQKRGTGVTLTQLAELFRGSKSQTATKFLDTSRLQGYGAGSKYKKYEIDRIVHAMVFDRIISESSVQNNGGFNSDYVNLAENAIATRDGRRKFMVDFPKPTKKAPPVNKTKPVAKKKKTTKKAAASKKDKSVAQEHETEAIAVDDSDDENYEIDDDDEILAASSCKPTTRSKLARSVLPLEHTNALSAVMKTLATGWASEAQILGNKLFYWNIMKNDVMKNIAATVPMSIEELREIDGLGENVIKEYGVRIVKAVAMYIENHSLQEYVAKRPVAKKPKVAEVVDLLNDDDEFGSSQDIDFGSIEIPDSKPPATEKPKKASKYFGS